MRTQRFQYGILLVHGNSFIFVISCFGGELLLWFYKIFYQVFKRYLQHFINNFMVNNEKYSTHLTTLKMGFETWRIKRSILQIVFGWSIWRQDLGRSQNWMKELSNPFVWWSSQRKLQQSHGLQIPGLHTCVGARQPRLIDNSTSFNLWQFYNLRIK